MVAAVAIGAASQASARVVLADLPAFQKSPDPASAAYIDGALKGILVASNLREFDGQKALVCPPDDFKFIPKVVAAIVQDYVAKHAPNASMQTDIVIPMLYALRDKYPCH
jgi:hypothetical protein